ncbi:LysR family transcriptional regulator [Parasulfitobacter algicola]|uniref:LysR family transcriptional regulator n=1 Tax=Parasulfitobacter algicola TaxID=2614809 RepID=A0ABX2IUL7_9RHOB|nr:LysR family transcriptional regulator [Sulfitobacter algicola]NSX55706.1 LysR family transcriptional regulator [Sulfitobacter algicola]
MNLKSLKVFALVMEEGTLARAADRINLSQSAASRLLQILEEEFSIVLFRRDKKRLIPTPIGERFYPEALRILAQVDQIPDFFAQMRSDAPEALRLICHPRIVNGLVLPAIVRFAQVEPNTPVKLEIYPRRDLGRRIMNDRYDFGISTLPLPVDTIRPNVLGTTELRVALHKDHSLAQRDVLGPVDIKDLPYIALDDTTVIRRIVDRAMDRANAQLSIKHEVSAGSAAYRLVQSKLGFTFADPVALDPEVAPDIALVPWQYKMAVPFGYFLPPKRDRHPEAAAFAKVLQDIFDAKISGAKTAETN